MSDFESRKGVLLDLLMEAGDEDTVAALRNLEWLVKVQKHAPQVRSLLGPGRGRDGSPCPTCSAWNVEGGAEDDTHDRGCSAAEVWRDILGPQEVERQVGCAHEEALQVEARRNAPAPSARSVIDLHGLNELFKQAYPAHDLVATARAPSVLVSKCALCGGNRETCGHFVGGGAL